MLTMQRLVIIALSLSLGAAWWLAYSNRQQLTLEKRDHDATRVRLQQMEASRDHWAAAYAAALDAAKAQRDNAAACLAREAAARTDAAERADILAQIVPAAPDKQKKVVDDATRKRAADRLNRVWH